MRTNEHQLFAKRNDQGQFQIQEDAIGAIDQWSKNLPKKLDLVVMDEFGKWEAKGGGIMPFWSAVAASKPRMVVLTLRQGVRKEIEEKLGRKFDKVFEADDPTTPRELGIMFDELRDWELVGTYGASSGGIEASLGSWLHGIRFPFVGTVMGSIQAAMLAMASKGLGRKELVVWISTIAAGLKALSPSGSRIGPMIAIAAQGFLFMVGAVIGRWSKFGFYLGAFLVGLWAALQGFFIQFLLLGRSIDRAWGDSVRFVRLHLGISVPNLWIVIMIVSILNGVACMVLTSLVVRRSGVTPLTASASFANSKSSTRQVLFWLPLILVTSVLFLAGENPMGILWMVLRAFAVLASLWGLGKLIAHMNTEKALARLGWGPAVAIRTAKNSSQQHRG